MSHDLLSKARLHAVTAAEAGQRLDNYLLRQIPGVPKTRLYRAIRKGEVRVNKGRAKPEYRVQEADQIRIPPLSMEHASAPATPSRFWQSQIQDAIVMNSADLLAINKPSGLAVHGGSGIALGLIESLRSMFPEERYLELVHRLDRDTSGLVLIAKNARTLRDLHAQLREDKVDKRYWALVEGRWPAYQRKVSAPLAKRHTPSGERIVRVDAEGKTALTEFRVLERFQGATLIEAKPISGRTHQIRVHCQHGGHTILGDSKYENDRSRTLGEALGLKRLFLHAKAISFQLEGQRVSLECPLSHDLQLPLNALGSKGQR